ncbi:MAG: Uma2 family endonuclease [Spirochaetaceae bacterium]|jgi:Uma2 family endonuclease|nr:Uma2 family endonuclease [Spirochaetaceae bacterium]
MSDVAYADEHRFTYADYKDWELKPGERYELIDGVAYAMAAPNIRHQRISMYLSGEFSAFLKGKRCEVFAAPVDVRLFYEEDESDETVVQPDLIVVCDPRKLGEEGCRGAPDMVIEILSPSNSAIEMERKLELYRDAGVQEYWIVDPKNKHVRAYSLKDGQYTMRTFYLDESAVSEVLPGLEIPLTDMFAE